MSTANTLTPGTLTGRHVAVIAMAATGPAAVLALNFGPMAAFAGPAFVLALVGTLIAVLFLANTLVQFSRRYASAGSIYTWVTRAFGQRVGFVVGWLFGGSYLLLSAAAMVVLGYWGENITGRALGVAVPWWVWSIAGLLFVGGLAYRGIAQSARSMIVLFGFAFLVVLALSLTALVTAAIRGDLSVAPFQPSSVPSEGGWAAIGLAMTYGVLSCVGLEEATTLAEETKDAQRAIARGIWVAAIVVPATYVLASYAFAVGLGSRAVSGLKAETADPLGDVTTMFWGDGVGLWLVFLAVFASILGFTQSAFNAGVRVLYALGRERLLPAALGRVHHTHRTPHVAVLAVAVIAILLGTPLALTSGALNVWVYYGFSIGVMFLLIYAVCNVALVVDTLRHHRAEFHWLRHAVLPALGFIAMCYPLYRNIWPIPPAPFPLLAGSVLGWVLLGVVVLAWLSVRRPDAVSRAGMVLGELADADGLSDADEQPAAK